MLDNYKFLMYNLNMINDLKIFGLNKLSKTVLKRAYKKLSKKYHPDNLETGDEEKFIIINDAYNRLLEQCIEKTFVIKLCLDDLLNGKNITLNQSISINANYKMLGKPFIINHLGKKYKIIVRPLLDKNQKLVYSKGKLKLITILKG